MWTAAWWARPGSGRARDIVRQHGGTIAVQSEEGHGSASRAYSALEADPRRSGPVAPQVHRIRGWQQLRRTSERQVAELERERSTRAGRLVVGGGVGRAAGENEDGSGEHAFESADLFGEERDAGRIA